MRPRQLTRVGFGMAAAGLALFPIAVPAGAGDLAPGPGTIDYQIDPPSELADFTVSAPVLTDAAAEAIGATVNGTDLLVLLTVGLPDADGDGIPDIPEGDPGDRDLPPGTRVVEIEATSPDGDGDGVPDSFDVTLGPNAIAVDTTVETLGGGNSFLQGHCGGAAISYAPGGEVLDAAVGIGAGGDGLLLDVYGNGDGSRAFTESNPFQVRPDGKVLYFGFLPYGGGDGPRDHLWEITTAGVSLDSGGDDNPEGNNANAGVVDLGENIPTAARFTGVFPVQGWFFSANGLFCIAEGWVEFTGPFPLFTTPGAVATFFALGGISGLLFNARPAITFKV